MYEIFKNSPLHCKLGVDSNQYKVKSLSSVISELALKIPVCPPLLDSEKKNKMLGKPTSALDKTEMRNTSHTRANDIYNQSSSIL